MGYPQDDLIIRDLEPGDLDQIAGLEKICFTLPWSKRLFEEELGNPDLCFWLTLRRKDEPGRILAYAGFWKVLDEAHLTNLAVHPGFRGQGLAPTLMERLLGKARTLGCRRATLEVRAGNDTAIRLYTKLGFSPVAMRPGYYTDNNEDALIMWKQEI